MSQYQRKLVLGNITLRAGQIIRNPDSFIEASSRLAASHQNGSTPGPELWFGGKVRRFGVRQLAEL